MKVVVFGAAGVVGQHLCRGLVDHGDSVVCALRRTKLPPKLEEEELLTSETGVDITNRKAVHSFLSRHAKGLDCVWALAAPLSVDTERDPAFAERVVIDGLEHVLSSLLDLGLASSVRVCFSDSIGSLGVGSPRRDASARWLTSAEGRKHDSGSEYGRLKARCRGMLEKYSKNHGMDTRWAIIPGVLHDAASWGAGTTEYALEAMLHAAELRASADGTSSARQPYKCPVPLDKALPFIWARDLAQGLVRLQSVDRAVIDAAGSSGGYALAGFSFTARELLDHLSLPYTDDSASPSNSTRRALSLAWPETLCRAEAEKDLGFRSGVRTMAFAARLIMGKHARRIAKRKKSSKL